MIVLFVFLFYRRLSSPLKMQPILNLRIFPEPAVEAEADDAEEGFAEDAAIHLADALNAVDEDDWHFLNLKADFVGRKLHLYLEGIALEAYLVEVDGLEDFTAIALEAGSGVVDLEACDHTDVLGGEIAHQHASDRPVDDIHAADIT